MRGILVGATHAQGSFKPDGEDEAREYDNLVLILQKPIETVRSAERTVEGVGFTTVEAKCPWSSFADVFGGKLTDLAELEGYIGTEVSYFFNDKKKLDTVLL